MYLNKSDSSKSCPSNWTLVNSCIRGCGRTTSDYSDCDLCITLWVAPTPEFVIEYQHIKKVSQVVFIVLYIRTKA